MQNPLKTWIESDKRELKRLDTMADQVEALEPQMQQLSDQDLQHKSVEFRDALSHGKTLDDILIEAFAVCREGARRVLGMMPYHVQIVGGIVLHEGNIAEMRTGEGKTLTATMPVYLNALSGKGAHVITVNEYLSGRDAEEMGVLYNWLGCSVGVNNSEKSPEEKRAAYQSDIMYSTHSEIGFDYLRDHMTDYPDDQVQRPFNFGLVDEVDSVLIDEARTPLIVSGNGETPVSAVESADRFAKLLKEGMHFKVDKTSKAIHLTETGMHKAQDFFHVKNLYDPENVVLTHHIAKALAANFTMERDKDYMVANNEVLIIDSFTGRTMSGRRFSDGLHQALEAKEHVEIQKENKTMASITYQNLFRMYPVLSGMTGTAKTEKDEFRDIYHMDVITIPTNRPIQRIDKPDQLYVTTAFKYKAVVNKIEELHAKGQPVLVGTIAVESSEKISKLLDEAGIPHVTLNAKNNKAEADIVKKAGQVGAVTIATNMASRGTDIKLPAKSKELGGLAVIGTERAETKRVDDQLRGRSGRQGDPGFTQFYLSLEDELVARYGGPRVDHYVDKWLRTPATEADDYAPIKSRLMHHQVDFAQSQVEGNNYDARKQTLSYDNILREQREVIYKQRQQVMDETHDLTPILMAMVHRVIERSVNQYTVGKQKDFDLPKIVTFAQEILNADITTDQISKLDHDQLIEFLYHKARQSQTNLRKQLDDDAQLLELQRVILLQTVDQKWADHIDAMALFKDSVSLRSYAQTDPVMAYQHDSFDMFNDMIADIDYSVTKLFLTAKIEG